LNSSAPALHFAFLDSEINIGGALVTRDKAQLEPKGICEKFGPIITRSASPRSAALGRLRRLSNILDALVAGGANIEDPRSSLWRADVGKLEPVMLNFISPGKLFDVERRGD
jgi:hypothetical protein